MLFHGWLKNSGSNQWNVFYAGTLKSLSSLLLSKTTLLKRLPYLLRLTQNFCSSRIHPPSYKARRTEYSITSVPSQRPSIENQNLNFVWIPGLNGIPDYSVVDAASKTQPNMYSTHPTLNNISTAFWTTQKRRVEPKECRKWKTILWRKQTCRRKDNSLRVFKRSENQEKLKKF